MHLVNSFSVVTYFENEAAEVIDRLRRRFNPGCPDRAHITILPPRPLYMEKAEAIRECSRLLKDYAAFQVRLGEVELFDKTQVIKLSIAAGLEDLINLHRTLDQGSFQYPKNFEYVPHVTLGKNLPGARVQGWLSEARDRWEVERLAPPIDIDALTFVQQRSDGSWQDVAELPLAVPVAVRR